MSEYADDYDAPIASRDDWHTARKAHLCHACGETIVHGQRYHKTVIISDGSVQTTNRCERCEAIFQHLSDRMVGNSDEFCNWRLACGHEYRERWGEDPPPEIAKLAFWLPGDPL